MGRSMEARWKAGAPARQSDRAAANAGASSAGSWNVVVRLTYPTLLVAGEGSNRRSGATAKSSRQDVSIVAAGPAGAPGRRALRAFGPAAGGRGPRGW